MTGGLAVAARTSTEAPPEVESHARTPPGPDDLKVVATHCGLGLDDADLGSFSPMVDGLLTSWDAVEALNDGVPPGRHRAR